MADICATFFSQLTYLSTRDIEDVEKAFHLARKEHGTERRRSGELFFTHPVTVASYLADYHADAPTLIAALLHDVAEDTTVSVREIDTRFGSEVAHIVDGLTKFDRVTAKARLGRELTKSELQTATLYKLFETMSSDVRVGIVKIFDRLHNMRTIKSMPFHKQTEKARESMRVYAPLANKLGMWRIKNQLECLSLGILHPHQFKKFQKALNERKKTYRVSFPELKKDISDLLGKADIETISIIDAPEDISDAFDIWQREQDARILDAPPRVVLLLKDPIDCYTALGHIHATWRPVAGTFDDYIAARRHNLYRSLHTTVIYKGRRIKLRIRTLSMQIESQEGILSRWTESDTTQVWPEDARKKVDRLFNEFQERSPVDDAAEFDDRVRHVLDDVFKNQIIVYTPKGDMIELPKGATPIDFAYQIHTEIGHSCRGVVVNGERQPLTYQLKDGDSVHIDRHGEAPPYSWLDEDLGYVRTRTARLAIRRWYRRQSTEFSINKGRHLLVNELICLGLTHIKHIDIAVRTGYSSEADLYKAIGRADVTSGHIASQTLNLIWEQNPVETSIINAQAVFSEEGELYVIENAGEQLLNICKVCNPKPGDAIVGFVHKNNSVLVHSEGCRLLSPEESRGRNLKLRWGTEQQQDAFARQVSFKIVAYDRDGLLHEITHILQDDSINIHNIWSQTVHYRATIVFSAEMRRPRQVIRLLHRVHELKNVIQVNYLGRTQEDHIIPEHFFSRRDTPVPSSD